MEQKKLSITVTNANGDILFTKDPCIPQMVNAILMMFDDIGTSISIDILPYEVSQSNVSHSGNA